MVVLGGGLSALATAFTLAREGWKDITIVERSATTGGLAGSFERHGPFYPLGYHHISYRDYVLLFFLDLIGASAHVRWRKIRMLFSINGRLENLGSLLGFLRFPMKFSDKCFFFRMMLKAFTKSDWSDWENRSALDLVDAWGSPGVRRALFEDLTRVKFELSCAEVSAAWLGARLYSREGSSPLGYIPGANWTKLLCDGVTQSVIDLGVSVRVRAEIAKLHVEGQRACAVELSGGERIGGDLFVSTIPTNRYCSLVPSDHTRDLSSIRYTALISVVCATHQRIDPDFYWMTITSAGFTASGIFLLNSLNPTIGGPGENVINSMRHLGSCDNPLFRISDGELLARYTADFEKIFGFKLRAFWVNVSRVPMYSPIFHRDYRNPPVKSETWKNLYFAGNYRTFPSTASTGTALSSGLETGRVILRDFGQDSELHEVARNFRLAEMPRG